MYIAMLIVDTITYSGFHAQCPSEEKEKEKEKRKERKIICCEQKKIDMKNKDK